jgi:hypothetical protein
MNMPKQATKATTRAGSTRRLCRRIPRRALALQFRL